LGRSGGGGGYGYGQEGHDGIDAGGGHCNSSLHTLTSSCTKYPTASSGSASYLGALPGSRTVTYIRIDRMGGMPHLVRCFRKGFLAGAEARASAARLMPGQAALARCRALVVGVDAEEADRGPDVLGDKGGGSGVQHFTPEKGRGKRAVGEHEDEPEHQRAGGQ